MDRGAAYIDSVDAEHRAKLGQYFTHPRVADFMVKWVSQRRDSSIFDPAFGMGVFYDRARESGVVDFHGIDVDPCVLDFWRRSHTGGGPRIKVADYLLTWGGRHPNIVCNPPYARFQRYENRGHVGKLFNDHLGLNLSGYTNVASMFLLKSLSELLPRGRLAYIMPLEFLNTGYGRIVKEELKARHHLHSIIKLDCEEDVFPDATTTVGIILYDRGEAHTHVGFYSVESIEDLDDVLNTEPTSRMLATDLESDAKWMPYFTGGKVAVDTKKTVRLDYYGDVTRGIATGANQFFGLTKEAAEQLRLGREDVVPCITKSNQIERLVFGEEDYLDLLRSGARALLFTPGLTPGGGAAEYVKEGERIGIDGRFLTRHRHPWFKQESRSPAPILVGVFSRGSYKVVRNRTYALNLTCFHGFYPNLIGLRLVDALFLYLCSEIGRRVVSLSRRRYGASLDKFEPNDLNSALVPHPRFLNAISDQQVGDAMAYVEMHDEIPAWVEEHFEGIELVT